MAYQARDREAGEGGETFEEAASSVETPLTDAGLRRLDRELCQLSRGEAALRLLAGESLERLCSSGWHRRLGFSSVDAYARERLGRSGRWVAEARALARRLSRLPATREAVVTGQLSWSKAEVIAAHADRFDYFDDRARVEADLLERARSLTVRALRASIAERQQPRSLYDTFYDPELPDWLSEVFARTPAGRAQAAERALVEAAEPESAHEHVDAAPDADDPDAAPDRCKLGITAPVEDTWMFEAARRMVEHQQGGHASADQVLDALLGEGLGSLLAEADDPAAVDLDEELQQRHRAFRQAAERERAVEEERAEPALVGDALHPVLDLGPEQEAARACDDPRSLDAHVRALLARLDRRELELGRAALRFVGSRGHRTLGYATEAQYARERLGLSRSALQAKMSLARRLERLPEVADALGAGELGVESARLVARISTPWHARAWLERAAHRTHKHLREEVHAVELAARLGAAVPATPPDAELLEEVQAWERAVLSGEAIVQMSGGPNPTLTPRRGFRSFDLTVTTDTARLYRALEREYQRHLDRADSFLRFLATAFWQSWHHLTARNEAYAPIYRRDRRQCASPTCTRTDVTPHHLRFRSQGGGDEHENLVSLCTTCHLFLLHEGHLHATPPASRIHWKLGPAAKPLLEVHGRELRAGR